MDVGSLLDSLAILGPRTGQLPTLFFLVELRPATSSKALPSLGALKAHFGGKDLPVKKEPKPEPQGTWLG